jgi:hypothetical protein
VALEACMTCDSGNITEKEVFKMGDKSPKDKEKKKKKQSKVANTSSSISELIKPAK